MFTIVSISYLCVYYPILFSEYSYINVLITCRTSRSVYNIEVVYTYFTGNVEESTLHTTLTWRENNKTFGGSYSTFLLIFYPFLSAPTTSVECEQGFNTMKIKDYWRNCPTT